MIFRKQFFCEVLNLNVFWKETYFLEGRKTDFIAATIAKFLRWTSQIALNKKIIVEQGYNSDKVSIVSWI